MPTRKNRKSSRKNRTMSGGRKMSAFFKFMKKERPVVLKEKPNLKFTEIGKELGKRWRALSEADKKRYT
jgi:hypothetical protein